MTSRRILHIAVALLLGMVPTRAAPITLHIAPNGSDLADGSARRPFASPERARDALRELKKSQTLSDGAVVLVHGGQYAAIHSFTLAAQDSGTSNAPIIYRAASGEKPVFSGGIRLTGFVKMIDAALAARLPEAARGRVWQCNVTNQPPLELGGFASGRGFRTHPTMELFFDGRPLPLAGWPDKGFTTVASIDTNAAFVHKGKTGTREGVFTYEGDRPARWQNERDLWLYGYWFWDWADSYERVASIDPATHTIELAPPLHTYGFRKGQPYRAVNAFCEIDTPGEWYLDRDRGNLFVLPPSDPNRAVVELSVSPSPFLSLNNASFVRFEGLTWELGGADGLIVEGGHDVTLAGCTVRRCAGNGIEIRGGTHHAIRSCDVYSMGRGGIVMHSGTLGTLSPGGSAIENCHIHSLSRIDHTYTPGILLSGVGNRVANCLIHDVASSAIRLGGNDHVVERNEICRVVLESDDQGGVDMWGDPTARGNVFRDNFFHHIGSRWAEGGGEPKLGQAGIRLDDAISGVRIEGNVFLHAAGGKTGFGAVQIHGGKDNAVASNLFLDCTSAISFSPWDEKRWRAYVRDWTAGHAVDTNLYFNRYPQLARLAEDHNTNTVTGNLVVNCGEFLRRDRGFTFLEGNRLATNNASLPAILKRPDAPRIALQQIGLQRDAWRRDLPVELGTLRRNVR